MLTKYQQESVEQEILSRLYERIQEEPDETKYILPVSVYELIGYLEMQQEDISEILNSLDRQGLIKNTSMTGHISITRASIRYAKQ